MASGRPYSPQRVKSVSSKMNFIEFMKIHNEGLQPIFVGEKPSDSMYFFATIYHASCRPSLCHLPRSNDIFLKRLLSRSPFRAHYGLVPAKSMSKGGGIISLFQEYWYSLFERISPPKKKVYKLILLLVTFLI